MSARYGIRLLLFTLLVSFCGCESSTLLRSGSKMKVRVQASWQVEIKPISDTEPQPTQWNFSNEILYITRINKNNSTDTIYSASYSISTTINSASLTIAGLVPLNVNIEGKWNILDLDDEVLRISRSFNGGGLAVYEFSKIPE